MVGGHWWGHNAASADWSLLHLRHLRLHLWVCHGWVLATDRGSGGARGGCGGAGDGGRNASDRRDG